MSAEEAARATGLVVSAFVLTAAVAAGAKVGEAIGAEVVGNRYATAYPTTTSHE